MTEHNVRFRRARPASWRREPAWPFRGETLWLDHETAGPQTEDTIERGFYVDPDAAHLGQSECVDPDEVGDIADEGPGRRG